MSIVAIDRLVLTAALAGIVACAPPIHINVASSRARVAGPLASVTVDGTAPLDTPTVVVRYYSFSPTVAVVAWDAEEGAYGLRAAVRRDGSLIRDHQFFVSTYYFVNLRSFARANWHAFTREMELARPLVFTGFSRDVHHCEGDKHCSAYETLSARIPDDFLRASRDSVVVKIRGRGGREEIITLHREMIDAYLSKLASLSAELQVQKQLREK